MKGIKKVLSLIFSIVLLCSCYDGENSYYIVVGKDKSLQRRENSVTTEYILSIKNDAALRNFDFSVTVGYYNKVDVGDTISFGELLLNLKY